LRTRNLLLGRDSFKSCMLLTISLDHSTMQNSFEIHSKHGMLSNCNIRTSYLGREVILALDLKPSQSLVASSGRASIDFHRLQIFVCIASNHLLDPSHLARISPFIIPSSNRLSFKSSHAASSLLDTACKRALRHNQSVLQSLRTQSPATTIRS
jgi:hypothetical protein